MYTFVYEEQENNDSFRGLQNRQQENQTKSKKEKFILETKIEIFMDLLSFFHLDSN